MDTLHARQIALCERAGSGYVPCEGHLKVGLALDSVGLSPIYGVRIAPGGDTTGSYIWAGPYSSAPDFFKPVHTCHLSELLPLVLPYLGLRPGSKFVVDEAGYEDIWFEDTPAGEIET